MSISQALIAANKGWLDNTLGMHPIFGCKSLRRGYEVRVAYGLLKGLCEEEAFQDVLEYIQQSYPYDVQFQAVRALVEAGRIGDVLALLQCRWGCPWPLINFFRVYFVSHPEEARRVRTEFDFLPQAVQRLGERMLIYGDPQNIQTLAEFIAAIGIPVTLRGMVGSEGHVHRLKEWSNGMVTAVEMSVEAA